MRCPSLSELPPPPDGKTGWPWTSEGARLPQTRTDGGQWPLITIVTPSYNQGEFLEATIRSVLLQGYPNLEYIVNDGGSSDGSRDIILKYQPWFSNWQSEPDGGQYQAIEKGFQQSSGDLLAWLNSDDLYFPWTLRVIGDAFSALPQVQWLTTAMPCQMHTEDGLLSFQHITGYSRRAFFSQRMKKRPAFIQQEGCFWRRGLWDRAGAGFKEELNMAGDYELWTRFWRLTDLYALNIPLGMFRYHPGQKTSSMQAYLQEARQVSARQPKPFPFPQFCRHS